MSEYDHLKAQKDRIERTQARVLAQLIAERLFVNGSGDRAKRLQLRDANERDLGGWCREAAEDQIIDVILGAPKGE